VLIIGGIAERKAVSEPPSRLTARMRRTAA
jgi:hypothetical protein